MSAALHKRVEALETKEAPADVPQVIELVAFPDADNPTPEPTVALIVGRPGISGGQVSRNEGETAEAFKARVEAERYRVHGAHQNH